MVANYGGENIMKIGYLIEETLKFRKEIILETELTEDELINEMDNAERRAESAEDVASILDKVEGIKVVSFPDYNYNSPTDMEIEYYDHRELK